MTKQEKKFEEFKKTSAFKEFASKWMQPDEETCKPHTEAEAPEERKAFEKAKSAWTKFQSE